MLEALWREERARLTRAEKRFSVCVRKYLVEEHPNKLNAVGEASPVVRGYHPSH